MSSRPASVRSREGSRVVYGGEDLQPEPGGGPADAIVQTEKPQLRDGAAAHEC